jgi:signal recognition particle subunit SRP54
MVLEELGGKLSAALRSLSANNQIDQAAFDALLKEITNALAQSDVEIPLVMKVRANIVKKVNIAELGAGTDKRAVIERAVQQELCALLDGSGDRRISRPRKGKPYIVMMVGLQARTPPSCCHNGAAHAMSSCTLAMPAFVTPLRSSASSVHDDQPERRGAWSCDEALHGFVQGNGKTTTCMKFAYHYKKKGYKPAMVCADTFRAGAYDQLKQNATRVGVPFYGSYDITDPAEIARDGVRVFEQSKKDIIIVDTSGRHAQSDALFEEMRAIAERVRPDMTVFVMDATTGQSAGDQARAFRASVDVGGVIITKMDGSAKGGSTLSAVAATKSPVLFIGTGALPTLSSSIIISCKLPGCSACLRLTTAPRAQASTWTLLRSLRRRRSCRVCSARATSRTCKRSSRR